MNISKSIVRTIGLLLALSGLSVSGWSFSSDTLKVEDSHMTSIKSRSIEETIQRLLPVNLNVYDPIIINEINDDSISYHRNRARTLKELVIEKQKFRSSLDNSTLIDLPIGIVKDGNVGYTLLIDKIFLNERGSFLQLYMSIDVPQFGKPVDFRGICQLTAEGGIIGTPRLYLLGDYEFDIGNGKVILKGGDLGVSSNSHNLTFVEFECNGFKGLSLQAEVQFSKEFIVAEDLNGNALDERVKFNFQTYITDWNDLLIGISLPPFQITGVDGLGFSCHEAFLDWSDYASPPGFAYPEGYNNPLIVGGQFNLWRGLYLRRVDIRFPPQFKERGDPLRRIVGVENFILDQQGVHGKIFAENLIRTGDLTGWSYSIDRLNIVLVENQPTEFSFAGKINVPAFEQASEQQTEVPSLLYTASRSGKRDYVFDVKLAESLPLKLLSAQLKLKPGSEFLLRVADTSFFATVRLNGEMSILAAHGNTNASLNGIHFENLVVSNHKPYFRGGIFSFGHENQTSEQKFAGFPLTITSIGIRGNQNEPDLTGLQLGVKINFVASEEGGFAGTTSLTIWGKTPQTINSPEGAKERKQKWTYEKLEIDAVSIDIAKSDVFDLSGSVDFFEGNQIYGNGFKGRLSGTLGKAQVNAEALFGKVESTRYWNANALVCVDNGLTITAGLDLYGFGGGVYYKMKPAENQAVTNSIGRFSTGVTYIPDEKSFLGLKAGVVFGTPNNPEPMNGDATFEININRTGGINFISFTGNVYFMSSGFSCMEQDVMTIAKTSCLKTPIAAVSSPRAQVMGQIKMVYDRVNSSFHGNIAVFVNAVDGLVKGTGANKKAGNVEVHFAPNDWYVLIGTPAIPVGIEVANLLKLQSYFMMGMNLPSSPPPPDNVRSILNGVDLDYARDMPSLQGGRAYAFGASLRYNTSDLKFLMFYGRFAVGAGFDLMLRDYGQGSHCSGMAGPLGINGWYANGQAYAYLEGKIGIRVNTRFYKGDYDILKIGVAAILQAKGPNPFWMKGAVGGYYSILGGLVKGDCHFEVTLGKPCEIIIQEQNALSNLAMIAEVSPVTNEKNVNVFTSPQAAFNIPVEKEFEITDEQNVVHTFRAKLEEFSVKNGSTTVIGQLRWNANHDVLAFDSHDVLPGFASLSLRVRVSFEEKIKGIWQKYKVDGQTMEETMESVFETGEAPDYVPESNVLYAYPVHLQQNFYPEEYPTGFVVLKRGQPDLFVPKDGFSQIGRFLNIGSGSTEFNFSYNKEEKKISFAVPPLALGNEFYLQIINKPSQQSATAIDQNVKTIETDVNAPQDLETTVTTKDIEGQLDLGEAKVIYGATIRTSLYPSFKAKLNSISSLPAYCTQGGALQQLRLYSNLSVGELFDELEISGNDNTAALVSIEAQLDNNSWYNNKIYPLVYEGYPLMGSFTFRNRVPDILGIPPVRAIQFEESLFKGNTIRKIAVALYEVAKQDHDDLQTYVANYVSRIGYYPSERFKTVLASNPPLYEPGEYPVRFRYVIPGINVETSSIVKSVKWVMVIK